MRHLPEPKIKNRFSDCVVMKLHFKCIDEENEGAWLRLPPFGQHRDANNAEVNVSLTVNFSGEQTMVIPAGQSLGLPNGRITFGIRRGKLQLTLDNCTMPLETIELGKTFETSLDIEQNTQHEVGVSAGNSGFTFQGRTGSSQKTKLEEALVKFTGSERSPAWIFEVQKWQTILEGKLRQVPLGILRNIKSPCQVKAKFEVQVEDIYLTRGNLLFTKGIHRNKLAVIERALVLQYIKPRLESYPISELSWQYD